VETFAFAAIKIVFTLVMVERCIQGSGEET